MPDDKDIVVIDDNEWRNLDFQELKEVSKEYFDIHLKGKKVTNKDQGVEIILAKSGWKHTIYFKKRTYNDIVVFKKLDEVIEKAKFEYYSKPDVKDAKTTLGFINYQCNILINGALNMVKFSIRIDKNGRFYYDHYIKK